jgi:hypothetical protein
VFKQLSFRNWILSGGRLGFMWSAALTHAADTNQVAKGGHGFGLHSDGTGPGATFTLELRGATNKDVHE